MGFAHCLSKCVSLSLTLIHLVSRLKVSERTMEHTHCWDVQEGEGQSSEGRSRRSTQNRRDPGGWASLYRRPRSNRENCCQVHLSPFMMVNGFFTGHVITDRKDWCGNAFSVIFQLSTLFQTFLPYWDLWLLIILWFWDLFSNLEETHVRLLGCFSHIRTSCSNRSTRFNLISVEDLISHFSSSWA